MFSGIHDCTLALFLLPLCIKRTKIVKIDVVEGTISKLLTSQDISDYFVLHAEVNHFYVKINCI